MQRRGTGTAAAAAAPLPLHKGRGILSTLKAATILDAKANLPAEIIATIIDYLPVADQMRIARASHRMREMVYDDTRWVSRLRCMGCWNEHEARKRFEESVRRRREAAETVNGQNQGTAAGGSQIQQQQQQDQQHQQPQSSTLFDAAVEEQKQIQEANNASNIGDGFETMNLGSAPAATNPSKDPSMYLDVFKNAKSIRGAARQEYGKIYAALAPFYFDVIRAKSHADPIIFRAFRDPERQAQMLSNLVRFSRSDWAAGCNEREEKMVGMMDLFEGAVLREFEQGYEFWDVEGRMKKYATVLHILNGAKSGIEIFIAKHPIFDDADVKMNPVECLNRSAAEEVWLEPSRLFFEKLLAKVNDQSQVIERIFPEPAPIFWIFLDKIREDIIMDYVNPLFDEAHERNAASYLKCVSGVFEQALLFFGSVQPPANSKEDVQARALDYCLQTFEPHLDLYLQEELDFFTKHAESQVSSWEKKLSEQDSSLESFYMSNINRSAEKKDFLSSFKKVVMLPVTALPTLGATIVGGVGGGSTAKLAPSGAILGNASSLSTPQLPRAGTPQLAGLDGRRSPLPEKAPDDELAAKAAIMSSKLEGIKSLFSIEVAINLTHAAQASIQRAGMFINLGGQMGGEAKEECANIFIALLRILGQRHVHSGFDMAVDHLSHYNPREVTKHDQSGVAPLVTFIELVNVGDLISQMIDVFYEQQLSQPKIADKNDFLDPANMAKKKFEQMLDESVAAGLNKGIDVLMDEVEYLNGSTQLPTDYNPIPPSEVKTGSTGGGGGGGRGASADSDIGPTATAQRIVDLVSSHTNMLVGTTEKSMLDVFNGEVGLRLFTAICKHLKRQRISTDGAIKLIADMNLYFDYIRTLKNQDLLAYFKALRELSQIYLIDASHAKEMATVIADGDRFGGILRAEEVYEFAQRRADWYLVKRGVERAMYGMDCCLM